MAESKIRVLFESVDAGKLAADFAKISSGAGNLKVALDSLASVNATGLNGLAGIGKSVRQAASGFAALSKISGTLPNIGPVVEALGKLTSVNQTALTEAGKGLRSLSAGLKGLNGITINAAGIADVLRIISNVGSVNLTAVTEAGKAIRTLAGSLKQISGLSINAGGIPDVIRAVSSVGSINTTSVTEVGKALRSLAGGLKQISGLSINAGGIPDLIRAVTNVGAINTDAVKAVGAGIRSLASGAKALNGITVNASGLSELVRVVTGIGAVNTDNAAKIGKAIRALATGAKQLSAIPAGLNLGPLATELGRFGSINATNLEKIGKAIRSLASGIKALSGNAINFTPLVTGLQSLVTTLNQRGFTKPLSKFAQLANSLRELGRALATLGRGGAELGTLAANLDTLVRALSSGRIRDGIRELAKLVDVAKPLTEVGKAFGALARGAQNLGSLTTLAAGIDRLTESLKRLAAVSTDANLREVLASLRALREAERQAQGGAGGRGGRGGRGAGGTFFGNLGKGISNTIKSGLNGISAIGSVAAGAIGFATRAAGLLVSGFVSLGRLGVSAVSGVISKVTSLGTALKATAIASALGTGGIGLLGKKAFDADDKLGSIVNTLKAATGSGREAQAALNKVAPAIDKMGLSFAALAPSYASFLAATKGTSIATADAEKIFFSVSNAAQALGKSTDDQQGILLALGQILSKGKVQAEELRGQIGERLPGAFNIAARAIGVTTAQLDDMLKTGQLTAEDFLPKFAAQLDKEFGKASNSAERPRAALERLKNAFFEAFVVIGRSGATKFIVDVFNSLRDAILKLSQSGALASFTRRVVDQLNRIGRAAVKAGGVIGDALAIMRRPGLNGRAIVSAPNNPFGPLTDPKYIALFNSNRKALARGYADLFNLIIAFGQQVRKAFRDAFGGVGRGSNGVGFLQDLNYILTFIGRTAVPLFLSGVKSIFSLLSNGAKFVKDFFAALAGTDFYDQMKITLGSIASLFTSLGNALGGAQRKAGGETFAQRLANGVATAAYVIGLAIDKVVTIIAYFEAFLIRLGRNGTFKRIGQDAKDFLGVLAGAGKVAGKDLTEAPATLADAFEAAYVRISDGIRRTFAYIKKVAGGFLEGFRFEKAVRKSFDDRGKPNARTPDVQSVDPTDQDAATAGQRFARLSDAFVGAFPVIVQIFEKLGGAIKTAGEYVLALLNGLENLVGTNAFTKILGLAGALLILRRLTGVSLGGSIGQAGTGFIGSLLIGMGSVFKDFLVKFALLTGQTGSANALAAGTIGRVGLLAILPGLIGGAIAKLNDSKESQAAQERSRQAFNNGDYLTALKEQYASIYGLGDSTGKLASAIQSSRFAERFGIGKYDPNGDGLTDRERQQRRDAMAQQQAALAGQRNDQAAAAGKISAFQPGGTPINLTIGTQQTSAFTPDPNGFNEFIEAVKREQAASNGQTSIAFGQ